MRGEVRAGGSRGDYAAFDGAGDFARGAMRRLAPGAGDVAVDGVHAAGQGELVAVAGAADLEVDGRAAVADVVVRPAPQLLFVVVDGDDAGSGPCTRQAVELSGAALGHGQQQRNVQGGTRSGTNERTCGTPGHGKTTPVKH